MTPEEEAEVTRRGGFTGPCPVPGCGTVLQGRDERVVGMHLAVVHPDWRTTDPGTVLPVRRPR